MNIKVWGRIRTEIHDAKTGRIVKRQPWHSNLILDGGLARLVAGGTSPASIFTYIHVGDNSDANFYHNPSITFTQSGNTITASGVFFTSAMIGGIFKYGTGTAGAEQYITAVDPGGESCTVSGAGMTVSTPEAGTVWRVHITTLGNELHRSNTYRTLTGDNQSVQGSASITHQRTFIIPNKTTQYTVNEIGYGDTNDTTIRGRVVLSSSDVIGTENFYVVVIQLTVSYSPNTPTPVINVGTNINTQGSAMIERYANAGIGSNGSNDSPLGLDGGGSVFLMALTSNYNQAAQIGVSPPSPTTLQLQTAQPWSVEGSLGRRKLHFEATPTTNGQTVYGFGLVQSGSPNTFFFDVKLDTPFTLPTGAFAFKATFYLTYTRTLTNP